MASKLEHALALARRGFKIFPLAPGRKDQPLLAGWPQLATSDEKIISLQWGPTGTPDANIGIHCEGLLVIDVDVKKGGYESFKALREMLDLPETLCHATPTGGQHVIYCLPEGHPGVPNSVEELGKGLDIRSTGGYVVAPGSTVEAGEYGAFPGDIAPAPAWLVQRLGTAVKREAPAADVPDAPEDSFARALDWLHTAERSVKGAGGDQAAYRVACRLRDLGLSYQQACEAMRSEAWEYGCGWREGRLEEKPIASAYKYAQHEQGGSRGVVEDDLPLPRTDEPASAPKKRAKVTRADDFAAEQRVGPGYVVKNLLNRASHALAYGPPGAGKTFVLLDIAYHVANSKPWMGQLVRGGPVLYLAYEGIGGLGKRVRAMQKKYGSLGPLYLADASQINLREQAGRQELGRLLAELPEKPVLVIIDTFAHALCGGDENSAQDVGALTSAITALIRSTGACVLVVHHSGKDATKGARGSSAILGALDTEISVNAGAFTPTKQRDLDMIPALYFKLRPVQIGIDEDGDEETSCAVEQGQATAREKGPLKGALSLMFKILGEMGTEANEPVDIAVWKARCVNEGVTRQRYSEGWRELKARGYITVENGFVTRRMT
jgi:RecA/RadA recombinase